MPKYTKLLTPAEYERLTPNERVEYVLDMAEVLKASRQTPKKTGIPLRTPTDKPKTN